MSRVFPLLLLAGAVALSACAPMSVPDASLSRLCTGDFSRILVSGGPTPRQPCRVQVVKKLTEAEVTALPARDRP